MTSKENSQRYEVYGDSELLEDRHRTHTVKAENINSELTLVPLRCSDENGDIVDSGFTKVEITQLKQIL